MEGEVALEGWRKTDSEVFARFGEVFTPGREEIEQAILAHVPAERGERFLAVDVGCGSGWLGEAVLGRFPNSRLLALDGSPEMLVRAENVLAPYGGRAETRLFRLEEPGWTSRIEGPVRLFVSCLAIHHLDGSGKRRLFGDVLGRLRPGGALLFADVVRPASERGRRYASRLWDEEVRRRSLELTKDEAAYETFSREGWNVYEHPDPVDKPSGVVEQLRWLEEAGFEGVDAPWARAGHAVFCAYRPERS